MIRRLLWVSLIPAILAGCGCQNIDLHQARMTFQTAADVSGVRLAVIETRNGSVTVETRPALAKADVSGSKYARGATLALAQQRLDQIQIRVEREANRPDVLRIIAEFNDMREGSPGASFRIALPPEVELAVSTSNGSVTAAGTRANVKAETSNGSITVEDIDGTLNLRTSNASVTALHVSGDVEAVSSNGSIRLEEVGAGRVHAVTSNASITAKEPRGEVSLVTSNGSVNLKAASAPSRVEVRTSNAGVNVKLASNIKGTLRLDTSNASVHSNLAGAQVSETRVGRSSFSAVLNGGGNGLINVETSNGSIHFDLIEPAVAEK